MKILIVLPRFPYPLEKGDKLRAFNQIRQLSATNSIYLFALSHHAVSDTDMAYMKRYCQSIELCRLSRLGGALRALRNLFSGRSLQLGYWSGKRAERLYRRYEESVRPDVVYAQMVRTAFLVESSPRPKVLDYQDALSLNFLRRMEGRRGLSYFLLHYEFKMLRSAEYSATTTFDRLTVISSADRDAIPHRHTTHIDIVPNGVDLDYFNPQFSTPNPQHPTPNSIVFCGNMQYTPNVQASNYLVREVMPLVWERYPDATLVLAGATPSASVRRLASRRVIVTGTVDDIRTYYASSMVFVAPMLSGTGMQNKILEAMAIGTPCVTTSLAASPIGATVGTHLLVGDNNEELAQAIITLLSDPRLRERMADNALHFVRDNFSWQSACQTLSSVLVDVASKMNNDK